MSANQTPPSPYSFDPDEIAQFMDSPALRVRRNSYPARYAGRVPRVVRTNRIIRSDVPADSDRACVARPQNVYLAWTNSYGAVSAITPTGNLGLKPHEFEIIEWVDPENSPLVGSPGA